MTDYADEVFGQIDKKAKLSTGLGVTEEGYAVANLGWLVSGLSEAILSVAYSGVPPEEDTFVDGATAVVGTILRAGLSIEAIFESNEIVSNVDFGEELANLLKEN